MRSRITFIMDAHSQIMLKFLGASKSKCLSRIIKICQSHVCLRKTVNSTTPRVQVCSIQTDAKKKTRGDCPNLTIKSLQSFSNSLLQSIIVNHCSKWTMMGH
jgi:hypothetical protein